MGRLGQQTQRTSRKGSGRAVMALAVLMGMFVGLGSFAFVYGHGASYLSDDPKECINCHVMQSHYDAWVASSHHAVATCNDCHIPHTFARKWATKADNGFFHSLAFTTGDFPEVILIKERNRKITQHACLDCHSEMVNHMLPESPGGETPSCVHCHQSVGHAAR